MWETKIRIKSLPPEMQPAELRRLDETPPLRDRIYEQLEAMITSGAFAPGSRLVESELAQTLGVSRGPIREALQLLWRDGFVDLRPRQGAFVHVPTHKEIDDFFDIRRALEVESVRLASLRATPEVAKDLRASIALARDLLKRGEDPSDVERRINLHAALTAAADNPLLAQMLRALDKRATWYRSPFELTWRQRSWDEHDAIVKAVIAGDTEVAVSAMAAHIDGARQHLHESSQSASADQASAPAADRGRHRS
jgi:DNA-binding GntR family transcriptional regulator